MAWGPGQVLRRSIGIVFADGGLLTLSGTAPAAGGGGHGEEPLLAVLCDPDAAPVSFEEALAKASDNRYGLCASILTSDQDRGLDLAQRLDCGMVHVNGPTMASEPSLPNGGVKESGWGPSGPYAVEDFTEIRLMTVTRGTGRYPI